MFPIRTILHPTDFSEPSSWAFSLACSLARAEGARLIALHVAPPPVEGKALEQKGEYDQEWNALQRLQAPGPAVQLDHLLRLGDPAQEILEVAQETKCDLIVMGTHGRTGLGRLLMGSVAEQVLRRAVCPVLTVKMPVSEEASVPG